MSYRYIINEIKTSPGDDKAVIPRLVEKKTGLKSGTLSCQAFREDDMRPGAFMIKRESIDARDKSDLKLVYTVEFEVSSRLHRLKHARPVEVCKAGPAAGFNFTDLAAGSNLSASGPQGSLFSRDPASDSAAERPPLLNRPVIAGFGPCGIFAALTLAKAGLKPIVIERGSSMEKRISDVEKFRSTGVLDPESNMLFGEGGAGTFSDGKLTSGIRNDNIRYVLETFHRAGADDDILYKHRPHIGTDVLRKVIVNIRKEIESLGGEVRFDSAITDITIEDGRLKSVTVTENPGSPVSGAAAESSGGPASGAAAESSGGPASGAAAECSGGPEGARANEGRGISYDLPADVLILAIGHSARDTFQVIYDKGLDMEQKPMSIGVRVEHPQSLIDMAQYGADALSKYDLPPAEYRLSYKSSNGRGVYSFCMCPGGEVVVCSTADGELCVNGMSNKLRDSGTANSGILCDVRCEDYGADDPLAGVRFQQHYEMLAYQNSVTDEGGWLPPTCTMAEFLGRNSDRTPTSEDQPASPADRVINSLPDFAVTSLREALPQFGKRIAGYDNDNAVIKAVETRSSSPVRILRDKSGMSNIQGVFPAGEGAGYAGGITSAACDGIRAAERVMHYIIT